MSLGGLATTAPFLQLDLQAEDGDAVCVVADQSVYTRVLRQLRVGRMVTAEVRVRDQLVHRLAVEQVWVLDSQGF